MAVAGKLPTLRQLGRRRVLTVQVTCDGACSLTLAASVGRAVAKRLKVKPTLASASVKGAGSLTARLTLSRKLARALARQKRVTVTLSATGTYGSGSRAGVRTTVTLRR